jgi:hypothetical protein
MCKSIGLTVVMVCLAITGQAIQGLLRRPAPAMPPASNDPVKFTNADVKLRRLRTYAVGKQKREPASKAAPSVFAR